MRSCTCRIAELVSLDDLGIPDDAVEDAATFRGNAILKARFYAGLSGLPTLADDSGLEVDALDGGPGVPDAPLRGRERHRRGEQRQAARRAGGRAAGAAHARATAACWRTWIRVATMDGGAGGAATW